MKRFYKTASAILRDGAYRVELDGRPVLTPKAAELQLPTQALAMALALEWQAQGDEIRLEQMPLTKLANTALDRVVPARAEVIANVARYGANDLICYQADRPDGLVRRQIAHWQPLRDWLGERHGICLAVTSGIVHVPQSETTLARFTELVSGHDDMTLATLHEFTTITGSLVIALALSSEAVDLETAWAAALVEEIFQAELWGEDTEAMARRCHLRNELGEALRFLQLLRA